MIHLEPHPDGTVLPVRVRAGARRNGVLGEHAGALRVAVAQPPEKGKANRAVITLLATVLGLRASQIELLSGPTAQNKRFLVRGLSPDELSARIGQGGLGKAGCQ